MCCRQEVNLEGYMVGYLQVVQVRAAQSWLVVDQDWILLFYLRHLQFLGEWVWYNTKCTVKGCTKSVLALV